MVSDSEDQAGSDSLSAGTHPANNVNQAKDKAKDDHQEDQGAGHGLLPGFVATMLGLGSFLYVLGFVVIVVHTSRLRVPMIEALRFQNIVAGLPIGLVLLPAFALWRHLTREIVQRGRKSLTQSWGFAAAVLLSCPAILAELWFFFLRGLSTNLTVIIALLLPLAVSLILLGFAYFPKKFPSGIAVTQAMIIYSLLVPPVGAYAWWVYPELPQWVGGGRPEKVMLYTNSRELAAALGATVTANESFSTACSAYVYYRTSDYLLLGKDSNDDHRLIQTSADKVQGIVWTDSHSQ